MKIKKTLKEIVGTGLKLILPVAFVFGIGSPRYVPGSKIANAVEYHDGKQGVSKEDISYFRQRSREIMFPKTYAYIRELDYVKNPITNFQFREHLVRALYSFSELKELSDNLN